VPAEQSVRSPMSQRRGPHLSRAATRALNVELAQRRRKNRTRRGEGHGGYALPATAPHTRDEDLVDTCIDTPWGRRACGHYTQHGTLLAALQNVLHRAADGLEDEVCVAVTEEICQLIFKLRYAMVRPCAPGAPADNGNENVRE